MSEVHIAHTADLGVATLAAARALLDAVFEGGVSDHDWEHALGGVHALAWEGDELVGQASVVRGAYDLGALSATDEAADLYAARGWKLWLGPTSALTPTGVTCTEEEDGSIYVLPVAVPLDLSGELTCDWRDGDVW